MGRARASFCVVAAMAVASRLLGSRHYTQVTDWKVATLDSLAENRFNASMPTTSTSESEGTTDSRSEFADVPQHLASIRVQTKWINGLASSMVPAAVWDRLPDIAQSWLRNWIFSIFIYFGTGFTWSYYIYHVFGTDFFPNGNMPTWKDMQDQMLVSAVALPMYSMLPAITESLCESGWTLAYGSVSDVGLPKYIGYLFLYMFFVEFGVYWMHRKLHEVPFCYKWLHAAHHKYNKGHTMSPFAGLAFSAMDGILQALPYTLALFVVPMHFFTHEILLFMTAFWAINIHDNIHSNVVPIMGAGWHTIHHTDYKHNYGHYFICMDWFFGSLLSPEQLAVREASRKADAATRRAPNDVDVIKMPAVPLAAAS